MSASAKKKLRKELEAAKIEEKQLKEKKEARKLKAGSTIFVVALVVILVAAIAIGAYSIIANSGIIQKNTVAATVGDHQITALDASFYYSDTVTTTYNDWVNSYGDNIELYMLFMGLDLSLPLDQQPHPQDENKTWADYFVESALDRAKSEYTLADMATAEGHKLTEEEQAELDSAVDSLALMALYSGYQDEAAYLFASYGPGADVESYTKYLERSALATSYYNAHADSLTFTEEQISTFATGKELDYTAFSYASYYVACSDYTTGDDTKAGEIAAEVVAKELANNKTVEDLDKAIAALPINADVSTASSAHYEGSLYTAISSTISTWLAEEGRVNGDTTVIPMETTTEGVTSVSGYYVVLFEERNDNNRALANVRHLLVEFENKTNPTDDQKAAAKAEAEKILADLQAAGTVTDEAFAAKATELTDDTGSAANGGLYEDILPVQGIYEENFTNWAVDPARKTGDVGIVETYHGYHVMFYVGDDEMTYREYLMVEDMKAAEMDTWYNGIMDAVKLEKLDISNLKTDLILGA